MSVLTSGGYDAAGLTIAGYFTDKPVHVYDQYTFHKGKFYQDDKVYVQPADKYNFVKPVYVLTSDISRSAAESFAMQMKALPNVKLVGSHTLGILSDMLGKSIGEYYLTQSNRKYSSPQGDVYEVSVLNQILK
jgi:C-terminal processing protease CtpA/Prc